MFNVAIFGAGRIGQIHARNAAAQPELTLKYVIDPNRAAADALAKQTAAEVVDIDAALSDRSVSGVIIASATNAHLDQALLAAAAGKAIFCEKPLDLDLARARSAASQLSRARMLVGFNRRFDPHFAVLKTRIDSNAIGKLESLNIISHDPAPPPVAYIRTSGGLFKDMAIHDFDMARYLMASEVTEVYAKAAVLVDPVFAEAGDWDTACTTLTFENGAFAVIDNSRKAVYGYDQRVEMFGSEGMVTVANNTPDTHILCNREGIHTALPLHFFLERYAESYLLEMRAFIDAVVKQEPVPVGGEDGLKSVIIALAAGLSARENRPVKLSEIYQGAAIAWRA
jgi:myo-inositol 2-dehydrogenase / D-chiro-inositol 1-dehydrogenase